MGNRVWARMRVIRIVGLVAVLLLVGTACTKGRGGGGGTSYDVFVQKFRFNGLPATIPTGNLQINFTNRESFPIVHEMILLQQPAGKSSTDLINSAKVKGCTGGAPCESQYLHFGEIPDVSTGATRAQVFNLPPGHYFLACWQQGTPDGKDNGPTHLSIGMLYLFTVTP